MILHFIKFVNISSPKKRLISAIVTILLVILLCTLWWFTYSLQNFQTSSDTPATKNLDSAQEISSTTSDIVSVFPEIITADGGVATDTVLVSEEHDQAPEVQRLSPSPTPLPITVGVFAGTLPELTLFEKHTSVSVDIVATAVHWGNESSFPEAYADVVTKRGSTLFMYWYPMDYREGAKRQEQFHFNTILDGTWDDYIDSFAQAAIRNGGDIIIAPFEEVNGNWTYWNTVDGTYGTKEEYIKAFQYLRDKFRTAPNVRFAWVVNHVSVPDTQENAIASHFPGDGYVDIIGINAFNFGTPWLSFDTLIARAVGEVLPYHKPIYITSTASTPGVKKSIWIQDMLASKYFKSGTLQGFIWFNENKERDWSIWSDTASESVFRNAFLKSD